MMIMDMYPNGTISQIPGFTPFEVPPGRLVKQHLVAFVAPVVGIKGKDWTGRLIVVDQFHRKYKTQKTTFKWVGPAPQSH